LAQRFEQSRPYLESALAIRSRSQSGASERGATERWLAYVLDRLGELEPSELHYKAAIATFEEADAQPSLAATLGEYARMLTDAERLRDAEVQYRRQLEIYSKKGEDSRQAATSMAGLASVLADEGKFEEAADLAGKGIRLKEQAGIGASSADVHAYLGIVLAYWGKYAAALEENRKALELRLRGKASPALGASDRYNIGLDTEHLGRYAESEAAFTECLDQELRAYGKDSSDAARTELNLAGLLTLTGRYREAAEALRHAGPIVRKTFPPPSVRYTLAQGEQADLLLATGNAEEALSLAREALSIREGAKADSEWRQSAYLLRTGRILVAQHREAEALPYFTRVRDIWDRFKVPDHPDIAAAEWGLGVAEGAAGRFDEMEAHCRRALEIASMPAAPSPLDASAAHACLAETAAHAGQFAQAVSEQKQAVETFVTACPRPHPRSARLVERYAELLEAQGDAAAASDQRARAKELRDRHAMLEKEP
jgi:tetratricopeptide (TPR) repeat protein